MGERGVEETEPDQNRRGREREREREGAGEDGLQTVTVKTRPIFPF